MSQNACRPCHFPRSVAHQTPTSGVVSTFSKFIDKWETQSHLVTYFAAPDRCSLVVGVCTIFQVPTCMTNMTFCVIARRELERSVDPWTAMVALGHWRLDDHAISSQECRWDCFLGVDRLCADEGEACEVGNWRGGRGKCIGIKIKKMMMMKWVPIVLPWVIAPALFSVVVAAVHAWQNKSLLDALLFVGKPRKTYEQLNSALVLTHSASLS